MKTYPVRLGRRCVFLCYMTLFGMVLYTTANENAPRVSKDESFWRKLFDDGAEKIISSAAHQIEKESNSMAEWPTIRKIEIQNDPTTDSQGFDYRTTSDQLDGQRTCQSRSKMHSVTLLRISPLQVTDPRSVYYFDVDTTIFELKIRVNGSDPASTPIINPMGEIQNRLKRHALEEKVSRMESNLSKYHEKIKRHASRKTTILLQPPYQPPEKQGRQHQLQQQHSLNFSNYKKVENLSSKSQFKDRTRQLSLQSNYNQYLSQSEKQRLFKHHSRYTKDRLRLPTKSRTKIQKVEAKVYKNIGNLRRLHNFKQKDEHIEKKRRKVRQSPEVPKRNLKVRKRKNLHGYRTHEHNISIRDFKDRHKRSATMMTLKTAYGMAIWAIEPPLPGLWGFSMEGPEVTHVNVTALSPVDFYYEFLDILTMKGTDSQPVASETTLARIYIIGRECITNATLLSFANEAGEIIDTVHMDDPYFTQDPVSPDSFTDTSSTLIYCKMPKIPFYMALTGFDANGKRFHRISPYRVVPRVFVISLVDYKADPLVPGSDYKFGLRIRNKGRPDVFEVMAQFEDSSIFTARTTPNILPIQTDSIAHIAVIVQVKPAIKSTIKGALTIMVKRLSDNKTELMTETVTAMPMSFKIDYEAPSCKVVSEKGGCAPELSCHKQYWEVTISVTDSMTGVKSAVFDSTPEGAYTNVQFSFMMSNRTAMVDYGFNCCIREASIRVTDYANNADPCPIVAPWLSSPSNDTLDFTPNTTLSLTPPSVSRFLNQSTITPKISQSPSNSSIKPTTKSILKVTPPIATITSKMPSPTQLSTEPTPSRNPSERPSISHGKASSSNLPTTLQSSSVIPSISTSTGGLHETEGHTVKISQKDHDITGNRTAGDHDSWTDAEHSTLRLVAIIMGCIGTGAALAIILVCVGYKCLYQKDRVRKSSTGSDVTMGSSWESRSDGSMGADSLRLQGLVESTESSSNRSETEFFKTPSTNDRVDVRKVGFAGALDDVERPLRNGREKKWCDFDSGQLGDFPLMDQGEWKEVKSGDHDSFTVYVKVKNEDNQIPTASSAGCSPSGANCGIEEEEHHSLRLETAGKIYNSMLDIQRRMEEMERKRLHLGDNENQSQEAVASIDSDTVRACRERSSPRPTRPRNVPRPGLVYRDETPPGSPKIESPGSRENMLANEGGSTGVSCNTSLNRSERDQNFVGRNTGSESSNLLPNTVRYTNEHSGRNNPSAAMPIQHSSCLNSNNYTSAASSLSHEECNNCPHSQPASNQNHSDSPLVYKPPNYDQPSPWRADGSPRNLTPPELRRQVLEQNFNAQRRSSSPLTFSDTGQNQSFRISFPLQRNTSNATNKNLQGGLNSDRVVHNRQEDGQDNENGVSRNRCDSRNNNSGHCVQRSSGIREASPHVHYRQSDNQINITGPNNSAIAQSSFSADPLNVHGSLHILNSQCPESTDQHTAHGTNSTNSQNSPGASSSQMVNVDPANSSMSRLSPSVDMSEIGQLAIRNDLQHIRDRLLRFHRRIDQEIEEEERKSRTHSMSSGNHDYDQDGD